MSRLMFSATVHQGRDVLKDCLVPQDISQTGYLDLDLDLGLVVLCP